MFENESTLFPVTDVKQARYTPGYAHPFWFTYVRCAAIANNDVKTFRSALGKVEDPLSVWSKQFEGAQREQDWKAGKAILNKMYPGGYPQKLKAIINESSNDSEEFVNEVRQLLRDCDNFSLVQSYLLAVIDNAPNLVQAGQANGVDQNKYEEFYQNRCRSPSSDAKAGVQRTTGTRHVLVLQ